MFSCHPLRPRKTRPTQTQRTAPPAPAIKTSNTSSTRKLLFSTYAQFAQHNAHAQHHTRHAFFAHTLRHAKNQARSPRATRTARYKQSQLLKDNLDMAHGGLSPLLGLFAQGANAHGGSEGASAFGGLRLSKDVKEVWFLVHCCGFSTAAGSLAIEGVDAGDGDGRRRRRQPHTDATPHNNKTTKQTQRLVVWWFGISVLGHLWIWPLTLVVLLLAPAWLATVIAL